MDTIKINFDNGIDQAEIMKAAKVLKDGGVVAFPTETVYGLGADALNKEAVKKIFRAKGRPQDNPLIIHVVEEDLSPYVKDVPMKAQMLMDAFWPGPLTIILKKTDLIPLETSAGLDTVGVRMPGNETAKALIKAFGGPIAAPSANISGRPSPTNYRRCVEDLDGLVEMILGDGNAIVGLESTIVDYSVQPPRLLRPGFVTLEELRDVDASIVYDEAKTRAQEEEIPKAPGMKYRHYAPKAPMTLFLGAKKDVEEAVIEAMEKELLLGKTVGIFAPEERKTVYNNKNIIFVSMGKEEDLADISRNLFEGLRCFDDHGVEVILSEGFPEVGVAQAIMNRLKKASAFNIVEV